MTAALLPVKSNWSLPEIQHAIPRCQAWTLCTCTCNHTQVQLRMDTLSTPPPQQNASILTGGIAAGCGGTRSGNGAEELLTPRRLACRACGRNRGGHVVLSLRDVQVGKLGRQRQPGAAAQQWHDRDAHRLLRGG